MTAKEQTLIRPSFPLTKSKSIPVLSRHHLDDCDPTYVHASGITPFVGKPDASRLMAPHPFSNTRKGGTLPDIDMKAIWRMRAKGNFVIQSSKSNTYTSEAAGDNAIEYKSHDTLNRVRGKHTRSTMSPCEKYTERSVSSHTIGWHADTEWGRALQRPPDYGIKSSSVTRFHDNMHSTNMQLCLRLCK
mmetsp:Transcript_1402/g.3810  ORF Transcript_1402/g.3810 Transcript_1402/m.3810 type:complete len:188 (-) Transcript_1402:119-682(-)